MTCLFQHDKIDDLDFYAYLDFYEMYSTIIGGKFILTFNCPDGFLHC